MSDQRRHRWRSGRLISTPLIDNWAHTRTARNPSINNLPLETPAAAADTFVPVGRAALVTAAIIAATWSVPDVTAMRYSVVIHDNPPAVEEHVPPARDRQVELGESWRLTWDAQTSRKVAHLIPAEAVVEQVPPSRLPQEIWDSWAPKSVTMQQFSIATQDNTPAAVEYVPPTRMLAAIWDSWKVSQPWVQRRPGLIESVDNPPPRVRLPESIWDSWEVKPQPVQRRNGLVVSVDNPPPLVRLPQAIWDSWEAQPQPQQRAVEFPFQAVAADDPPPRAVDYVKMAAGWEPLPVTVQKFSIATEEGAAPPVVGDDPPPRQFNPVALASGWQPKPLRTYSSSVYTHVDALPLRSRFPYAELASWAVTWEAQRSPTGLPWLYEVPPDDPPPRLVDYVALASGWAVPPITVQQFSIATESGAEPPPVGDDPPPRRVDYVALASGWDPKPLKTYASGVYTHVPPPDDPPVRSRVPYVEIESWIVTWGAQRSTTGLPWLYVPPPVDEPPPRVVLPQIIWQSWYDASQWTVDPRRPPVFTESGPDVVPVVPEVVPLGGGDRPYRIKPEQRSTRLADVIILPGGRVLLPEREGADPADKPINQPARKAVITPEVSAFPVEPALNEAGKAGLDDGVATAAEEKALKKRNAKMALLLSILLNDD
jgi:hypothetical protein